MPVTINTIPAYGRSFTKREKAIESWENMEDFVVLVVFGNEIKSGNYINKADFHRYLEKGDVIQCRLEDGVYTILETHPGEGKEVSNVSSS